MDSFTRNVGGFFLAISLIGSASAATTVPLPTRGLAQKQMGAFLNSGDVTYPATFETRANTPATANTPSQQITRYTKRPVPLNKATAVKMAKGALAAGTGPVGLAISVGLIAASYLIDEDTGEITKQGQSGVTGLGRCSIQYQPLRENISFDTCISFMPEVDASGTFPLTGIAIDSSSQSSIRFRGQYNVKLYNSQWTPNGNWTN